MSLTRSEILAILLEIVLTLSPNQNPGYAADNLFSKAKILCQDLPEGRSFGNSLRL